MWFEPVNQQDLQLTKYFADWIIVGNSVSLAILELFTKRILCQLKIISTYRIYYCLEVELGMFCIFAMNNEWWMNDYNFQCVQVRSIGMWRWFSKRLTKNVLMQLKIDKTGKQLAPKRLNNLQMKIFWINWNALSLSKILCIMHIEWKHSLSQNRYAS